MDTVIIVLLVFVIILQVMNLLKKPSYELAISERFSDMIRKNAEIQHESDQNISSSIRVMQESLENRMDAFKRDIGENLKNINDRLLETVRENSTAQKDINENLTKNLENIRNMTAEKLNDIQKNVNHKLDASLKRASR